VIREGASTVAVGWDGRLTSPDLAEAVIEGVRAAGADALVVGEGPTPLLYFAVHHLDAGGGIQVTGSHNPPDYNGLKLMRGVATLHDDAIQELGRMAERGDFAVGNGRLREVDLHAAYLDRVLVDAPKRGISAVWDPGNGAVATVLSDLVARLPGQHTVINGAVDGRFPAHHPDPTVPENLADLQKAVEAGGHDLGFAFDGDGDRLGAVDRYGRILAGDELLLLLARDVAHTHPGAPIIADVKASRSLFDGIAEAGGEPVMWKTGHALIKEKLRTLNAPLAGEMSAHIFFNDRWYGFDDAIYAAVRVLQALEQRCEDLAIFKDSLPHVVNTPEIRFPCPGERKWSIVETVRHELAAEHATVTAIDGVRVDTEDGWWLLRASNTQDVLVARCEALDGDGLARLRRHLSNHLTRAGLAPDVLDHG